MQISILIANWNTCNFLRHCLQSILDTAQHLELDTIVVDNASNDDSVAMLRSEFPWVTLIENTTNKGFGRATNQAAQNAHGEMLMLLNPDTVLHEGTLQGMLNFLAFWPQVGAVGPRILNPDGSLQVSCSPRPTLLREAWRLFHIDDLHPLSRYPQKRLEAHEPQNVDVLLGACILLRHIVAEQTGMFDEQFFVYSEEVDLCLRIQKAGWEIFWLPEVEVTHYGGQSTRQAADQMFLELYRNKVKYFRKHGGPGSVVVYKSILYCAALARWLSGAILSNSPEGQRRGWKNLSRQYRQLIRELPQL